MGLDANAVLFYGIKLNDETVSELKLRDQLDGKRYCNTCRVWLNTPFCSYCGAQTEPRTPLVSLRDLTSWGGQQPTEHSPHSNNLELFYVDSDWPSPFYLYVASTKFAAGDVNSGPRQNEPKAIDVFALAQEAKLPKWNAWLANGCHYLGLPFDTDPCFYLALRSDW